jgi:hypothetical protein
MNEKQLALPPPKTTTRQQATQQQTETKSINLLSLMSGILNQVFPLVAEIPTKRLDDDPTEID